jgi:hypothetical protein
METTSAVQWKEPYSKLLTSPPPASGGEGKLVTPINESTVQHVPETSHISPTYQKHIAEAIRSNCLR